MNTIGHEKVVINTWNDYVCPFCYLEEPVLVRLEAEHAGLVNIRWRAFQLRPDPVPPLDPKGEYLAEVWKRAVYPLAAQRAISMKLPLIQPRSQLVLEAGLFAHCRGKGAAFNHAVFQAFFEYGKDIGDLAILRELAEQVGLNAQELSHSLTTGVFSDQRVRDEDLARELAIVSVPTMVISLPSEPLHEGTILVGAQPYEVLNEIVERKLKQRSMDARLSA